MIGPYPGGFYPGAYYLDFETIPMTEAYWKHIATVRADSVDQRTVEVATTDHRTVIL